MALQNRVDPWGQFHAVSARGMFFGNRGILHNENQEIVSQWRYKAWVTCQLTYKGRKRTVFGQRTYSELFFLDEATAYSAGHRPCAECRNKRYKEFKNAWIKANENGKDVLAPIIDKKLHADRAIRGGAKALYDSDVSNLSMGTMISLNDEPYLLWDGVMRKWSFFGYGEIKSIPKRTSVVVLTPRCIVEMFRIGFKPYTHDTANTLCDS